MRVLIVQGAGMDLRGKVQIEIFGHMTLEQLNEKIRGYAAELRVEVDILQSNVEGDVADAFFAARNRKFDAALINPGGFVNSVGPLPTAIRESGLRVIEVHGSNPAARGISSTILPACHGSVTGFGAFSYYLALAAAKELVG